MRSFQLMFWIIFIIIYALITLGTLQSLVQIFSIKHIRKFKIAFLLFALLICSSMIFLYVWPGDVRKSDNYIIYFLFNGILFLDFIYKIPLSFLFVVSRLFSKGRKRQTLNWIGFVLSMGLFLIILQGMLFGKKALMVKHVELWFPNLPSNFDNYKVIHISDIHLGSFFRSDQMLNKVESHIEKLQPDVILFTGDLVNNYSYELDGWEETFKHFNKNINSYSILGNHDYGNYSNWENELDKTKNFQSILDAHHNFGFTLLRNESTKIFSGNDSIYITGVENWGHPPFPQYANLEQALTEVPKNSFKILMTHDPAHWESQIEGKEQIELTLSGHTHGLQWGIKPAGILFSLSYLVRKNWAGIYKSGNSYLYVNTGLGTIGIPWRIDMPAELTVITLKRVEID